MSDRKCEMCKWGGESGWCYRRTPGTGDKIQTREREAYPDGCGPKARYYERGTPTRPKLTGRLLAVGRRDRHIAARYGLTLAQDVHGIIDKDATASRYVYCYRYDSLLPNEIEHMKRFMDAQGMAHLFLGKSEVGEFLALKDKERAIRVGVAISGLETEPLAL